MLFVLVLFLYLVIGVLVAHTVRAVMMPTVLFDGFDRRGEPRTRIPSDADLLVTSAAVVLSCLFWPVTALALAGMVLERRRLDA